ncbi:hypothetical protein JCM10212_000385 [Sporobolomyces blumeae]
MRTRSSASRPPDPTDPRLGPSPLVLLPPETIDHILSYAVPTTLRPRQQRALLSKYLAIHPSWTPLVRRRLYGRNTLIVGDRRNSDEAFLRLLEGTAAVGQYIQFWKLRLPDPDPNLAAGRSFDDDDPAMAFLPTPRLDDEETTSRVVRAFEKARRVRYLEMDLRVGTGIELGPRDASTFGGKDQLDRLRTAMQAWGPTLETFISAVADVHQRLQVFAEAGLDYVSPFVGALQAWDNLTHLDLWLVRLKLSSSTTKITTPDDDVRVAHPKFRLKFLRLRDVELSSSYELEFLLGTAQDRRSASLATLFIQDVTFVDDSETSAPLLSIFRANPAPAFSSSLTSLTLLISCVEPKTSPPFTLSHLSRLTHLEVGGSGFDVALFSSIFLADTTVPNPPSPPSHSLRSLTLTFLTHSSFQSCSSPLVPALSNSIEPSPFLRALFSHLVIPSPTSATDRTTIPNLESLVIQPLGSFPRGWTWAQRRGQPIPTWYLSSGPSTASLFPHEVETQEGACWDALEKGLRFINRVRRRQALVADAIEADSVSTEQGPIKLFKNKAEIEYADDSSGDEGPGAREGDDDEEEFDGDALFVPSSDDEAPVVMIRRDQDSDSDF